MAFTAAEIKNLALMELNHETITDWTDANNTDIPIINTQYALAKKVALTMYQWSWAFKYAILPTFEYVVTFPADRKPSSTFTPNTMPVANIEQTTGNTLNDLAVDAVTFTSQISTDGDYMFLFDGSDWLYDGNIVDLNDYGISFTGTPVGTDELNVEYVAPKPITEYVNDENKIYIDTQTIYLEYIDNTDTAQEISLTGINEAQTVGNYKRATLLPTDFLGYLVAYPAEQVNVLADYTNIGTVIYTNNESLRIKYVADVDESVFTPEFVDWFKVFLAQRLNGYLNGDMQRQQLLTGEEPFFFRKAKNIDSKRNKHDSLDGNPMLWIRGKIGGSI